MSCQTAKAGPSSVSSNHTKNGEPAIYRTKMHAFGLWKGKVKKTKKKVFKSLSNGSPTNTLICRGENRLMDRDE